MSAVTDLASAWEDRVDVLRESARNMGASPRAAIFRHDADALNRHVLALRRALAEDEAKPRTIRGAIAAGIKDALRG